MSGRITGLLCALALWGTPWQAGGQASRLTIAAASDLQTVFPEIVAGFERETGSKVSVTFGSSGNFFAQIQHGAPFDLFFSADIEYPRQLVQSGYADAGTLYEYATGRIVLWTRKDAGIDLTGGLRVLATPRIRRIAIANPTVAPYGRAAVAALRSEKLWESVQPKIVQGDNIAQTAQLADSGNADVAILAHSLALGPALSASGRYVEIPVAAHPPIQQGAVVVRASRNKEMAGRFLAFVRGPQGQATLRRFGFAPGGAR
jgi:molybdate transport system substrate-binding protein